MTTLFPHVRQSCSASSSNLLDQYGLSSSLSHTSGAQTVVCEMTLGCDWFLSLFQLLALWKNQSCPLTTQSRVGRLLNWCLCQWQLTESIFT